MSDRVQKTSNHPATINVVIEDGFIRATYESGNFTATMNLTRDEANQLSHQLASMVQDAEMTESECIAASVTENVERSTEQTEYVVQYQSLLGKWIDDGSYSSRQRALSVKKGSQSMDPNTPYRVVSSKGELCV